MWKANLDWISLACFAMSIGMTLVGGLAGPVSRLGRLVVFVLALIPLGTALIILLKCSTFVIELFGLGMTMEAELLWPGFATWLTMASAIVLMLSAVVVGWSGRAKSTVDPAATKVANEVVNEVAKEPERQEVEVAQS